MPSARQSRKVSLPLPLTLEGKYTEIERENRILLEKMSNIMQDSRPKLYNPKRYELVSLNREKRKKDLMKITIEN